MTRARASSVRSLEPWRTLALALPGARATRPTGGFAPQLLTLVAAPPTGEGWLCETKWDGYRLLADLERGKARLRSRNDLDWTARLPHLVRALEALPVTSARLDGELVALDAGGRSDFDALEGALQAHDEAQLCYAIFDLVALQEVDLSRVPLVRRKELLEKLLRGADRHLIYSTHSFGHAQQAYADAVRHDLEGIVCKRAESGYSFRRSRDWVKVKRALSDEFIVVGFTAPRGTRRGFGALLLAAVESGRLRYVGRVGTGFDSRQLQAIAQQLTRLRVAAASVTLPRHVPFPVSSVAWVAPRLVVEVAYRGIAKLGLLRQASFLRPRIDKSPADMGYRPR
ncbi:MAG TPA: non-homologous end-joining DNA ligase [Steroidobacteraceae bacterium]|nr:non-homologous end-joining DNA ligase [Steroidobacteraceae bacterium]